MNKIVESVHKNMEIEEHAGFSTTLKQDGESEIISI
jgi:hypothetical protein